MISRKTTNWPQHFCFLLGIFESCCWLLTFLIWRCYNSLIFLSLGCIRKWITPKMLGMVKGNMQLFSVDQQRSQALEANAASFAQFKVLLILECLCFFLEKFVFIVKVGWQGGACVWGELAVQLCRYEGLCRECRWLCRGCSVAYAGGPGRGSVQGVWGVVCCAHFVV